MHNPAIITLQELKKHLDLDPSGSTQDARLMEFVQAWSLAYEKWSNRVFKERQFFERNERASFYWEVENGIELLRFGMKAIEMRNDFLDDEKIQKEDKANATKWLEYAREKLRENPDGMAIWTREYARIRLGNLFCIPTEHWELSLNEPQIRISGGKPVLGIPEAVFFKLEVLLEFVNLKKGKPVDRLQVVVCADSDQDRLIWPRKIRKSLSGLAARRIYLPDPSRSKKEIALAVKDMYTVLCVFLIQEKFIDLDVEPQTKEFLFSHLRSFKGVSESDIDPGIVLSELLANYQFPEDYQGFRKYVAKVVKGLRAKESSSFGHIEGRDWDAMKGFSLISDVAAKMGRSKRTIYHWAKIKKLHTEEILLGSVRYLAVPESELRRLKNQSNDKISERDLIDFVMEEKGIREASARRWINRQKGLSLKDKYEKVKNRL